MPEGLLLLVLCTVAAVLGALAGWWLARSRNGSAVDLARAEAAAATAAASARADGLAAQLAAGQADGRQREEAAAAEIRGLQAELGDRNVRLGETETRLTAAEANYAENLARLNGLIAEADKRLADQFKAVAAQILEEKTAKFTETNRSRLDELLTPLRERLQEFQKKVEDTHLAEMQGQSALKGELDRLMRLNQQVSQEAHNLTTALKGESKTQGNWGELILSRALELSGLEAGREYRLQDSGLGDSGQRLQPDVVITLPDDRYLIIDAKVSLVAWERYTNADDDDAREQALAAHLTSLRNHVRSLGDKDYPQGYGLKTVDFVLLFVALEPALLVALRENPGLYEEALAKNVVLVGPSSLLATMRVVSQVWRLEKQNRNVEEIARIGGLMHDSFVSFAEELLKVQKSIGAAGQSVDQALRLLNTGGTSLVRRTEKLRELGVKAKKQLPEALASDDDRASLPAGPATTAPTSTAEADPEAGPPGDSPRRH
jgi:DNA recombination protein RmuC